MDADPRFRDSLARTPSYKRGDDGLAPPFNERRSFAARAERRPDLSINTTLDKHDQLSPASTNFSSSQQPTPIVLKGSRKGSVAERSPLQKLEVTLGDLSKEEKRARAEQAELQARQRATRRGNAASEGPPLVQPSPRKPSSRLLTDENTHNVEMGMGDQRPYPSWTQQDDLRVAEPKSNQRSISMPLSIASTATSSSDLSSNPFSSLGKRTGYDAARTSGAAAAAVGVFRASRRRLNEPRSPGSERSNFSDPEQFNRDPAYRRDPVLSDRSLLSHVDSYNTGSQHTITRTSEQDQGQSPKGIGETQMAMTPNIPLITVQDPDQVSESAAVAAATGRTDADVDSVADVPTHTNAAPKKAMSTLNGPARRHIRGKFLDEWKSGETAVLSGSYINLLPPEQSVDAVSNAAWWEKDATPRRNNGSRKSRRTSSGVSAPATPLRPTGQGFSPAMKLKCGPLLRYTGIKSVGSAQSRKEIWRGSVMIVSEDSRSSLAEVPTLRLFKQPSSPYLHHTNNNNGTETINTNVDTLDGLIKCSREGYPLCARHSDDLPHGTDLSRDESNAGLFERTTTIPSAEPELGKIDTTDGETMGKYREVKAHKLHSERGCTFWRFNIEVELASEQARISYRINNGAAIGFWVPAKGQNMNIMFHSCNGFSMSVNPNEFSGPDPLWRDVLLAHQAHPFHLMIGGGDQIYNDAASRDTVIFKEWLGIQDLEKKLAAPFSEEMQEELESFYLDRYCMWFSQGLFGMANSQIPMVNMWDDHDIIDGFGSYSDAFMYCPVFSGVGNVAAKYYFLFQQQSVPDESHLEEPSWVLGNDPGPYINEVSHSIYLSLGSSIDLLALDCRMERMDDEVLSQETYDIVFDRCRSEITQGKTKHLMVLLGVPIAYPRLNFLENTLSSRLMHPLKSLGRAGLLGGFTNRFDGEVEVLDDMNDHWTAKNHKSERNWFIQELQELAAEKSVRVTILGGDVHLAAIGQFFSAKTLGIPKDLDHRYMPNIISSAIVNTPPPNMVADLMNKRDKIHHLDGKTDESMIPMFSFDVDGKKRNNKTLLPRRNWCSIREFDGRITPPPSIADDQSSEPVEKQSFVRRSLSLGRSNSSRASSISRADSGKGGLFRRLSRRGRDDVPPSAFKGEPGSDEMDLESGRASMDSTQHTSHQSRSVSASGLGHDRDNRPLFQRKPSNAEQRRTGNDASGGHGTINLEKGLEVTIHCEIDSKNPSGETVPYRLLVPALFYSGAAEIAAPKQQHGLKSLLGSLRRGRSQSQSRTVNSKPEEDRNEQSPAAKTNKMQKAIPASLQSYKLPSHAEPSQDAPNHHIEQSTTSTAASSAPIAAAQSSSRAESEVFSTPPTHPSEPTQEQLRRMPRASGDIESERPFAKYEEMRARERSRSRPRTSGSSAPGGGLFIIPHDSHSDDARSPISADLSPLTTQKSPTFGPPPPSNIEHLPASVRKRYSSWGQAPMEMKNAGFDPSLQSHPNTPNRTRSTSRPISVDDSRRSIQRSDVGSTAQDTHASAVAENGSFEDISPIDSIFDSSPEAPRRTVSQEPAREILSDPRRGVPKVTSTNIPPTRRSLSQRIRNRLGLNKTPSQKPQRSTSQPIKANIGASHERHQSKSQPPPAARTGSFESFQSGDDEAYHPHEPQEAYHSAQSRPSVKNQAGWTSQSNGHHASDVIRRNQSADRSRPSRSPSPNFRGDSQMPSRASRQADSHMSSRASRPKGNQPQHSFSTDEETSRPVTRRGPAPYQGPGSNSRHDYSDQQGGLPLPRPVGLGMSERAAKQLGYSDGYPGESDGSWLNRSSSNGGRGQALPQRYYSVQGKSYPSPYGQGDGFESGNYKRPGGIGGLIRRVSDGAQAKFEAMDDWASGYQQNSNLTREPSARSWRPWKK